MSMLSNLDLIRRVPLFSMLTNENAQVIADAVVKRRFRRGEIDFDAVRAEMLKAFPGDGINTILATL